jgi:hypothetical protein
MLSIGKNQIREVYRKRLDTSVHKKLARHKSEVLTEQFVTISTKGTNKSWGEVATKKKRALQMLIQSDQEVQRLHQLEMDFHQTYKKLLREHAEKNFHKSSSSSSPPENDEKKTTVDPQHIVKLKTQLEGLLIKQQAHNRTEIETAINQNNTLVPLIAKKREVLMENLMLEWEKLRPAIVESGIEEDINIIMKPHVITQSSDNLHVDENFFFESGKTTTPSPSPPPPPPLPTNKSHLQKPFEVLTSELKEVMDNNENNEKIENLKTKLHKFEEDAKGTNALDKERATFIGEVISSIERSNDDDDKSVWLDTFFKMKIFHFYTLLTTKTTTVDQMENESQKWANDTHSPTEIRDFLTVQQNEMDDTMKSIFQTGDLANQEIIKKKTQKDIDSTTADMASMAVTTTAADGTISERRILLRKSQQKKLTAKKLILELTTTQTNIENIKTKALVCVQEFVEETYHLAKVTFDEHEHDGGDLSLFVIFVYDNVFQIIHRLQSENMTRDVLQENLQEFFRKVDEILTTIIYENIDKKGGINDDIHKFQLMFPLAQYREKYLEKYFEKHGFNQHYEDVNKILTPETGAVVIKSPYLEDNINDKQIKIFLEDDFLNAYFAGTTYRIFSQDIMVKLKKNGNLEIVLSELKTQWEKHLLELRAYFALIPNLTEEVKFIDFFDGGVMSKIWNSDRTNFKTELNEIPGLTTPFSTAWLDFRTNHNDLTTLKNQMVTEKWPDLYQDYVTGTLAVLPYASEKSDVLKYKEMHYVPPLEFKDRLIYNKNPNFTDFQVMTRFIIKKESKYNPNSEILFFIVDNNSLVVDTDSIWNFIENVYNGRTMKLKLDASKNKFQPVINFARCDCRYVNNQFSNCETACPVVVDDKPDYEKELDKLAADMQEETTPIKKEFLKALLTQSYSDFYNNNITTNDNINNVDFRLQLYGNHLRTSQTIRRDLVNATYYFPDDKFKNKRIDKPRECKDNFTDIIPTVVITERKIYNATNILKETYNHEVNVEKKGEQHYISADAHKFIVLVKYGIPMLITVNDVESVTTTATAMGCPDNETCAPPCVPVEEKEVSAEEKETDITDLYTEKEKEIINNTSSSIVLDSWYKADEKFQGTRIDEDPISEESADCYTDIIPIHDKIYDVKVNEIMEEIQDKIDDDDEIETVYALDVLTKNGKFYVDEDNTHRLIAIIAMDSPIYIHSITEYSGETPFTAMNCSGCGTSSSSSCSAPTVVES